MCAYNHVDDDRLWGVQTDERMSCNYASSRFAQSSHSWHVMKIVDIMSADYDDDLAWETCGLLRPNNLRTWSQTGSRDWCLVEKNLTSRINYVEETNYTYQFIAGNGKVERQTEIAVFGCVQHTSYNDLVPVVSCMTEFETDEGRAKCDEMQKDDEVNYMHQVTEVNGKVERQSVTTVMVYVQPSNYTDLMLEVKCMLDDVEIDDDPKQHDEMQKLTGLRIITPMSSMSWAEPLWSTKMVQERRYGG